MISGDGGCTVTWAWPYWYPEPREHWCSQPEGHDGPCVCDCGAQREGH